MYKILVLIALLNSAGQVEGFKAIAGVDTLAQCEQAVVEFAARANDEPPEGTTPVYACVDLSAAKKIVFEKVASIG